ncbi:MAG: hypothetical protein PWR31_1483 [Bacillota bacterium]|nr:hypothetical protein [Bacillota bacterium]
MKVRRLLALAAALLVLAGCSGNRVVGTVGERQILATDVDKRVALVKLFSPELDVSQVSRAGVVDQLLDEKVLLAEVEKQGIAVSTDKVQQAWQEVEAGLVKQFGDKAKLDAALKEAKLSVDDIKRVVENNLKLEELYQKVTAGIKVTPAEVEKYYREHQADFKVPEQVKASHILVADEKFAQELRARLLKGEDFAKLAKEYSTDPGSREAGGELGYFPAGQMVPEFDKAAFSTPVGELSPVIKSSFGYHIIKVEDKKPARTLALAEVEQYLSAQLSAQKKDEKFQAFLRDLKGRLKPENKLTEETTPQK